MLPKVADTVFSLQLDQVTTSTAWIGAVAYTLQIYFDFAGILQYGNRNRNCLWGLNFQLTLIFLMRQNPLPNSGVDGTYLYQAGSVTIFIFPLAATGRENSEPILTLLLCFFFAVYGTVHPLPSLPGECIMGLPAYY